MTLVERLQKILCEVARLEKEKDYWKSQANALYNANYYRNLPLGCSSDLTKIVTLPEYPGDL